MHFEAKAADKLPSTASSAGLILLDAQGHVVYFNQEALSILVYPESAGKRPSAESVLRVRQCVSHSDSLPRHFRSGRRTYACRSFRLTENVGKNAALVAGILLERVTPNFLGISAAVEQFGLSRRERETVELLTLGLTSKEIASRMSVSPNTVKVFFRLVMTKMAVNTRSGIVGKIARMQSVA